MATIGRTMDTSSIQKPPSTIIENKFKFILLLLSGISSQEKKKQNELK